MFSDRLRKLDVFVTAVGVASSSVPSIEFVSEVDAEEDARGCEDCFEEPSLKTWTDPLEELTAIKLDTLLKLME